MTEEQQPTASPPGGDLTPREQARKAIRDFLQSLTPITRRAWVTPALVAINLAVFAAFSYKDHSLVEPSTRGLIAWGANYGPLTAGGQWWRLLTCTFMHIGLWHVAINMAVLWDTGRIVEKMTGNFGFLVGYLISGLGGSIASVLWNPAVLSAGASGAVFGVFGMLVAFLVRDRGAVPPDVLKHLQRSALVMIAQGVFFGLAKSGIDNAAHIGGLMTGFLCGLGLAYPLTVEGVKLRAKRAAAVLVGGLLLVGGATFAIPKQVDFDKIEAKVVGRWTEAARKFDAKQMKPDELANVIEKELLPPWKEQREWYEKHASSFKPKFLEYIKLRQEQWEMLVKALRDDSQEEFDEANKKSEQWEKVLDDLAKTP
jgi:rhomboid protease GluP